MTRQKTLAARALAVAAATAVLPLALLATPAAAHPGKPDNPAKNKVVVIGIDGAMYDRIQQAHAPNLLRLAAAGTLGRTSIAPHTSISGPSWSTVLTGVWDTKHGIYDNNFDATPFAAHPTVFTQLERAKPGLTTESYATWGSIGIIAGAGDPHADVNSTTAAVPGDTDESRTDAATADASAAAVGRDAPDFLFTHLDQVDEAGHEHGSASPEYLDALRRVDTQVGKIVNAVDARKKAHPSEKWTVIVTCDHGHTPTGGHGGQTPEETANFVIARGPGFRPGAVNDRFSLVDITPTVVDILGVAPEADFDGTSMLHRG